MDQAYVVRPKVLVEGLSVRRMAREFGISRNTVRRYVAGAVPGERVPATPPIRPAYEAARLRMGELLAESPRWTGGKQRLTAVRLHQLVVAEGLTGGETGVKEYVREWRRGSTARLSPDGPRARVSPARAGIDPRCRGRRRR